MEKAQLTLLKNTASELHDIVEKVKDLFESVTEAINKESASAEGQEIDRSLPSQKEISVMKAKEAKDKLGKLLPESSVKGKLQEVRAALAIVVSEIEGDELSPSEEGLSFLADILGINVTDKENVLEALNLVLLGDDGENASDELEEEESPEDTKIDEEVKEKEEKATLKKKAKAKKTDTSFKKGDTVSMAGSLFQGQDENEVFFAVIQSLEKDGENAEVKFDDGDVLTIAIKDLEKVVKEEDTESEGEKDSSDNLFSDEHLLAAAESCVFDDTAAEELTEYINSIKRLDLKGIPTSDEDRADVEKVIAFMSNTSISEETRYNNYCCMYIDERTPDVVQGNDEPVIADSSLFMEGLPMLSAVEGKFKALENSEEGDVEAGDILDAASKAVIVIAAISQRAFYLEDINDGWGFVPLKKNSANAKANKTTTLKKFKK